MPTKKTPSKRGRKPRKPKTFLEKIKAYFQKRPLLGYFALTFALMGIVFMADQGTQFFKASIVQVPKFDGTTLPIKEVPNWAKTGGKNDRNYSDYASSQFIDLPKYDGEILQEKCPTKDQAYLNACLTYPVVYMGTYQLDHTEYTGSHLAIDIRAPKGTPVYAIANGIVDKAVNKTSGFGKHIVIRHANAPITGGGKGTLYSSYSHLDNITITEGVTIKKGDLIGHVGNTGTSTTPHLHFQIDRPSAPWHPWWPFSSTQASAAGLNFFSGINAGLGQADAKKHTINPMKWVYENFNSSAPVVHDSPKNDPVLVKPPKVENEEENEEIEVFSLSAKNTEINIGESVKITIMATKKNGTLLEKYSGENAELKSTCSEVKIPKISFAHGIANAEIAFPNSGTCTISIRDGKVIASKKITITRSENEIVIPEENLSVENPNELHSVRINTQKEGILVKEKAKISITAYDKKGNVLKNPEFDGSLKVSHEGVGEISPSVLKPSDFKDGIASIMFHAEKNSGEADIFIKQLKSEKLTLAVLQPSANVYQFGIFAKEDFIVGKKSIIEIKTQDKDGNFLPKSFRGKVEITLQNGKGRFSKTLLKSSEFEEGVAQIEFTPTSKEAVKIKVQSGVIVGITNNLSVSTKEQTKTAEEEIFSDISKEHKNYSAIKFLKEKGIIKGNPDGSYKAENPVNRAEFAKIILKALAIKERRARGGVFTDVSQDIWFAPFAETAAAEGLIKGYPDGSFGPGNNINRAELFTMLVRAHDENYSGTANFSDVPAKDWFVAGAAFAEKENLLDFGRSFEAEKKMTRGEVAEAVFRFLKM